MKALREIVFGIIATLAMLFGVIAASEMDYQDQKLDQQVYCQNVKYHTWPDYKHDYDKVCK